MHINKLENVVEIERKNLSDADAQALNYGMIGTEKDLIDQRLLILGR